MTSVVNAKGNNAYINGLLWGYKWDQTNLTYSFPTGTGEYLDTDGNANVDTGYQAINGFQAFNAAQQSAVRTVLANVSSFSKLTFTETTAGGADLRYANARTINYTTDGTVATQTGLHTPGRNDTLNSATSPGTAEANPPELPFGSTVPTGAPYAQGDSWYTTNRYTSPTLGNFQYAAGIMHETGHNLGLKHGHITQTAHGVTFPTLPADHNSYEYSVMTYSQFPGDSTAAGDNAPNHPTTFMQDDIAALQYMYGANYNYNSGNTVYTWSPFTGEMSFNDGFNDYSTGAPASNYVLMTLWDGGGNDTYNFQLYTTNLSIDLAPGAWTILDTSSNRFQRADLGNDGASGAEYFARGNIANALVDPNKPNETASLIENAIGGTGNDVLLGNAVANNLYGVSGNDRLNGRGGLDTLYGGLGDDYYLLQDVSRIRVGKLLTREDYDTVVEDANGGTDWVQVGHVVGARFDHTHYTLPDNVENVVVDGSDAFNVTGNELANQFFGNGAANTLMGMGGSDMFDGGGGLDTLVGGAGDDTYLLSDVSLVYLGGPIWGEAYDTVVEVAGVGTDTVRVGHIAGIYDHSAYTLPDNVENGIVDGVDAFDMTGNELANKLVGNDGANTLQGAGGDDALDGGRGSDTAVFRGARSEYVVTRLANGDISVADSVAGRDGTDLLSNIETMRFANGDVAADTVGQIVGTPGGDHLVGDDDANHIQGLGGEDDLIGYGGPDVLDGGADVDTADYSASSAGVTVDLSQGVGIGGDAEGDELLSIENVIGSAFHDVFTGSSLGNFLSGGAGNDLFYSGDGSDTILGGDGSDVLYGEAGDDTMDGGEGDDLLIGGLGDDIMHGGGGADMLLDVNGVAKLYGDDGDDTLNSAGSTAGLLDGGAGKDYLTVANGNYTLIGGAGDDTLEFAGFGTTSYTGGDGADVFTYRAYGDLHTTVTDFEDGTDHIFLWDFHFNGNVPFESLAITDSAAGAVITWNGIADMTLVGVTAAQITQADFVI